MKRTLRGLGISPDMWILPEGVKIYLSTSRPENTAYFLKGPAGPGVYDGALNGKNGTAIDTANDCRIVETKQFEMPGTDRGFYDPLFRHVTVGEYYIMEDHVSEMMAPKDYKTGMRDVYVYNEDKDAFSRVSLKEAFKRVHRFDSNGSLDDSLFTLDARGMVTELSDDMFVTDKGTLAKTLGEIQEKFMPTEVLHKMVDSCMMHLNEPTTPEAKSATTIVDTFIRDVQSTLSTPNVAWEVWKQTISEFNLFKDTDAYGLPFLDKASEYDSVMSKELAWATVSLNLQKTVLPTGYHLTASVTHILNVAARHRIS